MIIDQMTNWLTGSILFALGCLVLVAGMILINNLLHKFWKPVTVVFMRNDSIYPKLRFTTPDDSKEPEFESQKDIDKLKN
jgi:hypothetical protein